MKMMSVVFNDMGGTGLKTVPYRSNSLENCKGIKGIDSVTGKEEIRIEITVLLIARYIKYE